MQSNTGHSYTYVLTHTHTHTLSLSLSLSLLARNGPVERTSWDCRLFSLHCLLCHLPANELVMGGGLLM